MLQMHVGLIALIVAAAWADESEKSASQEATKAADSAAPESKKQEKRGLLGLGYGYAYDGGYDIGAAGHLQGLELSQGYGGGYDEGHHHEKVITVYKNVPVPYPVEKHIPYPVEKQVHVPVKVSCLNCSGLPGDGLRWPRWRCTLTLF
jgi:hypothetical protein